MLFKFNVFVFAQATENPICNGNFSFVLKFNLTKTHSLTLTQSNRPTDKPASKLNLSTQLTPISPSGPSSRTLTG